MEMRVKMGTVVPKMGTVLHLDGIPDDCRGAMARPSLKCPNPSARCRRRYCVSPAATAKWSISCRWSRAPRDCLCAAACANRRSANVSCQTGAQHQRPSRRASCSQPRSAPALPSCAAADHSDPRSLPAGKLQHPSSRPNGRPFCRLLPKSKPSAAHVRGECWLQVRNGRRGAASRLPFNLRSRRRLSSFSGSRARTGLPTERSRSHDK